MNKGIFLISAVLLLLTAAADAASGDGPQRWSAPSGEEVKFRGVKTLHCDLGVQGVAALNVEVRGIVLDPTGNLEESHTVTVSWVVSPPCWPGDFDVGDRVEVFGQYHPIEDVPPQWTPDDLGDHWVSLECEGSHYIEPWIDTIHLPLVLRRYSPGLQPTNRAPNKLSNPSPVEGPTTRSSEQSLEVNR
jgi:hypothetical protein